MQKLITLSIVDSIVDSKNNLVLQYDLNIYATQAKIYQAYFLGTRYCSDNFCNHLDDFIMCRKYSTK
jgi:hypothetical protein